MAPILIRKTVGAVERWEATRLRDLGLSEADLEGLIAEIPEVLGLEDLRTHIAGPFVGFRQIGIKTDEGRFVVPDLILISASGHVVVVEAKLADNPELRGREVVAQLLEYAATLTGYDEADLVELFDRTAAPVTTFADLVGRWFPQLEDPRALSRTLIERIRDAELHLVIACDRAPDGLRHHVRAVTAQHALGNYELRVVELVPFVGPGGVAAGFMVQPTAFLQTEVVTRTAVTVTVNGLESPVVNVEVTPQDEIDAHVRQLHGDAPRIQELEAAVEAFTASAPADLRVIGRRPTYRQIRPPRWNSHVHYEFLWRKTEGQLYAELHFEDERFLPAARAVEKELAAITERIPGASWDPNWYATGRVRIPFSPGTPPSVAAEVMSELIRLTAPIVDSALAGLK